ncbi:hypothetical protein F3Y22_tig00116965pilonHSYRG00327 [Hibiscus syriacus]|uniref:Uncharacterized protein n=1 Tax=Hibiscus syriacus TaxID=106335 RepID=A0A6A2X9V1_HIBSY|nr:hypothetical protein F3Y22_tig00116965pilonHSYRG00327 [Hibiscus syriacus]
METDDRSNSKAGQQLQFDLGNDVELGLEKVSSPISLKLRKKKMDGDGGSMKRLKVTVAQVGVDKDDDEPILSLLKLRKPKKPKKVKAGLEGSARKCHKDEVKAGKSVGKDEEDFGGMNDTLASFRKKLKDPKKDIDLEAMRVRSYSLNESVEGDGVLDGKSASKTGVVDLGIGEDKSDMATNRGVKRKHAGKVRRSKINSKAKSIEADHESGAKFEKDHNEEGLWPGVGSIHHLDEKLKEQLAEVSCKAQSGSVRKSRPNLSLKQNREADHHASTSKNPSRNSVDNSYSVSASSFPHSSSKECSTAENQRLDHGVCQQDSILEPGDLNVQKGPTEDSFISHKVCDKGIYLHSNIELRDNCPAVDQSNPEREGSQQTQHASLSVVYSLKMEGTCRHIPNTFAEDNTLETSVHPNHLVASIQRCNSGLHQPSEDACHGANVDSPTSTPDENESYHEDDVSLPSSDINDSKSSVVSVDMEIWLMKGILTGRIC